MITNQQIYALQALKCLAKAGVGEIVKRQEITDTEGPPTHFLAKILQDLGKRGVLEVKQGSKGGPRLIRNPEDISVLEVLEVCGGPLRFDRGAKGEIGSVLRIAQTLVEDYLNLVKISDLLEDED